MQFSEVPGVSQEFKVKGAGADRLGLGGIGAGTLEAVPFPDAEGRSPVGISTLSGMSGRFCAETPADRFAEEIASMG